MRVYLDVLFVLNAWVDYMTLLATARFSGCFARRRRLLAAGALGGAYAVLALVLPLPEVLLALSKILCAAALVAVAFGRGGRFWRQLGLFTLLSMAFAGAVMAWSQLLGGALLPRGVFYLDVTLGQILCAVILSYLLVSLVLRRAAKHGGREVLAVRVWLEGRQARFSALLDTGNDLTDPVSGKPVLVVEKQALSSLLPPEVFCQLSALGRCSAAQVMEQLPPPFQRRASLLSYRALGVPQGMLLAIRPDGVEQQGRRADVLLAVSPNALSAGGYTALTGSWE